MRPTKTKLLRIERYKEKHNIRTKHNYTPFSFRACLKCNTDRLFVYDRTSGHSACIKCGEFRSAGFVAEKVFY